MEMKSRIKQLAADAGYIACGITGMEPFDDYLSSLRALARSLPDSASLYGRMERRANPLALNPWARSIIVCIRRYGKYAIPETLANHIGRNYLCDRRIPACPDHDMPRRMKEGLRALGLRVRTGGVPSREAAVRAGVARIGRNGFAFTEGAGSWINIEAWMTDAQLDPDVPAPPAPCPPGCQSCQCACRTGAFQAPYVMDMKRCVAYLTYEAPLPVDPRLSARMGPWVYGCDDCQAVCPLNQGQWESLEPAPWLERIADRLLPQALATMDQQTYSTLVHPLFGYIPEHDLERWHTNARRALESLSTTRSPAT